MIALLVPDTLEIAGYREGEIQSRWRRPVGILAWRPSPIMLAAVAAAFVVVFTQMGRVRDFLYYQF
jgi:alginate O-acetyltransferase complex protein AlgI